MKRILNPSISIVLVLVMIVCLTACGNTVDQTGLWDNAAYRENTEFGTGAKTAVVEVKVEEQIVIFTIHTNKDTVGAALLEHGLIAGEDGDFGMYIKSVNGITADYDVDQSYWAFYVNGEYAMTGVDSTEITEGATYQLAYTK